MKRNPDTTDLFRRAMRGRSRAELKRIFALIRGHDDRALFTMLSPPKKRARRKIDPLVRDLEQTLKPILGPASEKADLLIEHLAKKHRRKLPTAKGLADAARQLRASKLSDDQIRAGATSLMGHLARLYGARESVV